MIDHPLQSITYITDIGDIVVLMARRRVSRPDTQDNVETSASDQSNSFQYKMICHVFESEDVSLTSYSFKKYCIFSNILIKGKLSSFTILYYKYSIISIYYAREMLQMCVVKDS
jgi:hypothetical protein